MTCRLDRLWPSAWLEFGLRRGGSRAVSITPTARQNWSATLFDPDPWICPAGRHLTDFWPQGAPTWSPRPAKVAIPLQRGIEITKTHFPQKVRKKLRENGAQQHLGGPVALFLEKVVPSRVALGVQLRSFSVLFCVLFDFSVFFLTLAPRVCPRWSQSAPETTNDSNLR